MQITCIEKEFVKILKQKNLGKYHDLYLESDTLLLEDVFENFRKMCLKNYRLAGLAWRAALKKTELKLELLTNIDMILMVEE